MELSIFYRYSHPQCQVFFKGFCIEKPGMSSQVQWRLTKKCLNAALTSPYVPPKTPVCQVNLQLYLLHSKKLRSYKFNVSVKVKVYITHINQKHKQPNNESKSSLSCLSVRWIPPLSYTVWGIINLDILKRQQYRVDLPFPSQAQCLIQYGICFWAGARMHRSNILPVRKIKGKCYKI